MTYRHPGLLAKIVTTLDVISSGRAILGIGAAWNDEEHAGYGFEFPPLGERFDRLALASLCGSNIVSVKLPVHGAPVYYPYRVEAPA